MENLEIRRAGVSDFSAVSTVLIEAAYWLRKKGMSLWDPENFSENGLLPQVEVGISGSVFLEGRLQEF